LANVPLGAEPDIFIWEATGGTSFATRGAVNVLCRTSERDLKNFGGAVAPLAPPSSAPA